MIYRLPTEKDEAMLQDYVREHLNAGEKHLTASMDLENMPFADWLARIRNFAAKGNACWGRSLCLLCLENDRLIGLLSVRWELSAQLAENDHYEKGRLSQYFSFVLK